MELARNLRDPLMRALTEKQLLYAWGESPSEVSTSLERFAKSARALSADKPNLIDAHPERWIALYNGSVKASGDSVDEVMTKLDEMEIPRSEVIVRFITRKPKKLFL
jgi:hypothetical protein